MCGNVGAPFLSMTTCTMRSPAPKCDAPAGKLGVTCLRTLAGVVCGPGFDSAIANGCRLRNSPGAPNADKSLFAVAGEISCATYQYQSASLMFPSPASASAL